MILSPSNRQTRRRQKLAAAILRLGGLGARPASRGAVAVLRDPLGSGTLDLCDPARGFKVLFSLAQETNRFGFHGDARPHVSGAIQHRFAAGRRVAAVLSRAAAALTCLGRRSAA